MRGTCWLALRASGGLLGEVWEVGVVGCVTQPAIKHAPSRHARMPGPNLTLELPLDEKDAVYLPLIGSAWCLATCCFVHVSNCIITTHYNFADLEGGVFGGDFGPSSKPPWQGAVPDR